MSHRVQRFSVAGYRTISAVFALFALTVTLFVACSGKPKLEQSPVASATAAQRATTAPPTVPPAMRQAEAIDAVVDFAVKAKLANLEALSVFSDSFTRPLLAAQVEMDQADLALMQARWDVIAADRETTIEAFAVLDRISSVAVSATRTTGNASPARGAWDSLKESASSFYDWIAGSGARSRGRVLQITDGMQEPDREAVYQELKTFYPEFTGGATDSKQFFGDLRSGKLDGDASKIHSALLDVSLTSDQAAVAKYAELAQDKSLRVIDIVIEEGKEGLERGAEFEVEASFGALSGSFPDLAEGRELADKANDFLEYARDTYNDPATALAGAVKAKVKDTVMARLGVSNDDAEEIDDFAESISGMVTRLDGLSEDSLLDAASGHGLVALSDEDATIGLAIAEVDGDGVPSLIVMNSGSGDVGFLLPEGKYTVRTFDDAGKSLTGAAVEVKAGWEQLGDGETASVARIAVAATDPSDVPAATAAPTPRATATTAAVYPKPYRWALKEVRVNPDNYPLRNVSDARFKTGQYAGLGFVTIGEAQVTDNQIVFTQTRLNYVGSEALGFEKRVIEIAVYTFDITPPPSEIVEGETVEITASGSTTGGGGLEFFFTNISAGSPSKIALSVVNPKDQLVSFTRAIPGPSSQNQLVFGAQASCIGCTIQWVYVPAPGMPLVPGFGTPFAAATATVVAQGDETPTGPSCLDVRSEFFAVICQSFAEHKKQYEAVKALRASGTDPCAFPESDAERKLCLAQDAVDSGEVARCDNLAEDLQMVCRFAIAENTRDVSLIEGYGEEVLAIYGAVTRDMTALSRANDDEMHDRALAYTLTFYIADLLSGDADARIPPANMCAQMRGGWAEDTDYPGDDESLRNLCEGHAGTIRAIQLDNPGECEEIGARFVESPFDGEEEQAAVMSDCKQAVADYRLLSGTP